MKAKSILSGKMAMVTGWGSGLAILFILFGGKTNLAADALRAIDILLAFCVSAFTFLVFSAVCTTFYGPTDTSNNMALNAASRKIQGWLFSIALLICGLFILDTAPEIYGAARAATALGLSMASTGAVVLYVAITKLIKRKKYERT